MKILILSDSHADVAAMRTAVERERPDRIFHLGDMIADARRLAADFPEIPLDAVPGNCDGLYREGKEPEQLIVTVEGARFLLTHGHRYHVKMGPALLSRAAREEGVDAVCFGHTHKALCRQGPDGIWMVNPGSVGGVNSRASYAVAEVEEGRISIQTREL